MLEPEIPPFFELLENRVKDIDSLLCIGLDPHAGQLGPDASAAGAEAFCLDIIRSTTPYAAAYKPNAAFFEAFGAAGMTSLKKVIDAIPKDIPVILDCKRGDIDTTAQAYATSSYDEFNAGAVTLSPYMGWDSVKPFVTGKYQKKGCFVLCRTSNQSASEFQELYLLSGRQVYQQVLATCIGWDRDLQTETEGERRTAPSIGVVVGATDLTALRTVRSYSPRMWILCPGVGAQGGEAGPVCEASLRADGSGVLVSVSRGISKATDRAAACVELRDEINAQRKLKVDANAPKERSTSFDASNLIDAQTVDTVVKSTNEAVDNFVAATKPLAQSFMKSMGTAWQSTIDVMKKNAASSSALEAYQKQFIEFAMDQRVLQFGSFKLKSGRQSPYFFNAGLFKDGFSMHQLGRFYAQAIKASGVQFDVIFGPAYKGITLATAVSIAWYSLYGETKDYCYNRKEVKDHGEVRDERLLMIRTCRCRRYHIHVCTCMYTYVLYLMFSQGGQLVGASMEGRKVLIVDDVITAGTAIREAAQILKEAKGELAGVAVSLDRQEKAVVEVNESAIQVR
jgi:uridine monophosphate synthetase